MAITDGVFSTILHGIPGTNLQGVFYRNVYTHDLYGDPDLCYDYIPLVPQTEAFTYPDDWNSAYITTTITELEEPVDGVKFINFRKSPGSDSCYIDYVGPDGTTLVAADTLASSWSCAKYDVQGITVTMAHPIIMLATGITNGHYRCGFALCNDIGTKAYSDHSDFEGYNYQVSVTRSGFVEQLITDIIGDNVWDATPGGPGGETGPNGDPGGGDGFFHRNDIDIPFSSLPSISVTDTGFVSLYKMSAAQLQALAVDLWDDNFFQSLSKNFADPFQNIISLGILPYEPSGSQTPVVIGNYTCPTTGDKLSSNYFEINCGSISVKEYFAHFGDYETRIQLMIPYCGDVMINPSEVMGGTIELKYLFDIFSGACLAQVLCYSGGARHVLYQKEGNIRTELPVSGANYAEYYKGLLSGITQIGASAASGNIAGVASGITEIAFAKPSYQRAGNIGGPAGLMGIQYPYLIFTTPNYFGGKSIGEECGYISNLPCVIGEQEGFLQTEVDFEKLSGIDAPIDVINGIKQDLAEGIYIEPVSI